MKNNLKKILLVPHCLITKGLNPQFKNEMGEVMQVLIDSKAGMVQMPCPHLILLQEDSKQARWFNDYDKQCSLNKLETLESLYSKHISNCMMLVDTYKSQGIEVAGLIGVSNSPTCVLKSINNKSEHGAFMNIVKQRLKDRDIQINMANINIPLCNDEAKTAIQK